MTLCGLTSDSDILRIKIVRSTLLIGSNINRLRRDVLSLSQIIRPEHVIRYGITVTESPTHLLTT